MVERLSLKIEGSMGAPSTERWSIGVNYAGGNGGDFGNPTFLQALATGMADFLDTTTNVPAAFAEMSTTVQVTNVNVYGYNGPGPAAASATASLVPIRPGTDVLKMPFQAARCISLVTGLPGGRRRGRVYVPCLSATMASSGKAALPSGYLTAWKDIFGQANVVWPGSGDLVLGVYSAVDEAITPVTSLRAGDVVDTQRRRRDSVVETYTSVTV